MTKAELAERIARRVELPRRRARPVLDAILDGMVQALRRGERIEVRGFGVFGTHARAAREGRHPRTGDPLPIAAKRVADFRPGRELLALVNGAAPEAGKDGQRPARAPRD